MGRKLIDLTGKTFGYWTVLYRNGKKGKEPLWKCRCICGVEKNILGIKLRDGTTQSCGCKRSEIIRSNKIKKGDLNKYDLSNEYGIGYTSNTNIKFYFDLEDYDKIKNYKWYEMEMGYIATNPPSINGNNPTPLRLHRLITNAPKGMVVDHINHNTSDNRKCNLRVTTQNMNMKNQCMAINNTSGYAGVRYNKRRKKWEATININGKQKILGIFNTIEEAHKIRLNAENEYYGEYSYKNSQEIAKVNNIKEVK